MKDGKYRKEPALTPERSVALALVLIWIAWAFLFGGLGLAIRAALLFMVPLTMIWFPHIVAPTALRDDHWDRDFCLPPSSRALRMLAWFVLIGVPVAWVLFLRMAPS